MTIREIPIRQVLHPKELKATKNIILFLIKAVY